MLTANQTFPPSLFLSQASTEGKQLPSDFCFKLCIAVTSNFKIGSLKMPTRTPKKRTVSWSDSTRPARELAMTATAQTSRLACIPSPARFILVVLSSLVVSSVLFTLTSTLTVGDLGPISKHLEEWWEVGGLIAWRAAEVGLAWVLGFDGKYQLPYTWSLASGHEVPTAVYRD